MVVREMLKVCVALGRTAAWRDSVGVVVWVMVWKGFGTEWAMWRVVVCEGSNIGVKRDGNAAERESVGVLVW